MEALRISLLEEESPQQNPPSSWSCSWKMGMVAIGMIAVTTLVLYILIAIF